jgi:hypothetical protein
MAEMANFALCSFLVVMWGRDDLDGALTTVSYLMIGLSLPMLAIGRRVRPYR